MLPQSVQDTFAAGREAPMPLILGNTSDDASVVVAFGVDPSAVIQQMRGAGILLKVLYPGVRGDDQLARQVTRDLVFTLPVRWTADRHAKLACTWRYYFDYTAVHERAKFPNGVPHGAEIVYALDTGDIYEGTRDIFTDQDRRFARRVSDYWFEFARTGKSTSRGGPDWPNDGTMRDRTMQFRRPIAVQANFMKARLNVFIGSIKILGAISSRK